MCRASPWLTRSLAGRAAAPGGAAAQPGALSGAAVRRVCLGGFLQSDLLAGEVLELADEVAGVALASGFAVVEAGAEVGVAGGGSESRWLGDGEDGVAGGDDRAFLAAAAGEPPVALGEEGVGAGGADDDFAESTADPGVALAGGAAPLLHAELFSIGANLADDTRWSAVGKRLPTPALVAAPAKIDSNGDSNGTNQHLALTSTGNWPPP